MGGLGQYFVGISPYEQGLQMQQMAQNIYAGYGTLTAGTTAAGALNAYQLVPVVAAPSCPGSDYERAPDHNAWRKRDDIAWLDRRIDEMRVKL